MTKKYENLLRIKELKNTDTELKETSSFFQTSFLGGSITNKYSREFGTAIFVFNDSKIDINKRIKDEIEEKKNSR